MNPMSRWRLRADLAVTRQTRCDNIARVSEMDGRLLQKQTIERYQKGNWCGGVALTHQGTCFDEDE